MIRRFPLWLMVALMGTWALTTACGGDDAANDPGPDRPVTRRIIRAGVGTDTIKAGDVIVAHYILSLTNGRVVESSYDAGVPFTCRLATADTGRTTYGIPIRGWVEGLPGMKLEEIRQITVPPEKGYGSRSDIPNIPPNSTLVFNVELLRVIERGGS